jgi:hypothetical protein
VLTSIKGNIGQGVEYSSGNAKNITDDGEIVISDVSDDSGIENKETLYPIMECFVNKHAEKKIKLENSRQIIVQESHL